MVSATNICCWNIRGFRSNYTDLQTLLVDTQAAVMRLQETKLPEEYPLFYPRGFSSYLRGGLRVGTALEHCGVSTVVENNVPHQLIPLNTGLQAVAVRCQLDRLYSICNLYLPTSTPIVIEDLADLIHQLPPPYIIIYLEISMPAITFGETLELIRVGSWLKPSYTLAHNCSILNDGKPTHFHIQTDSISCIDLSITSSDIVRDFTWRVSRDLNGSDHFP